MSTRLGLLAAIAAGCSSQPGLEVEVMPAGGASMDLTSFRAAISRDNGPVEELRALRPIKGPPWRLQVVSNGMTRGHVLVRVEGFRGDSLEATGTSEGVLAVPWTKLEVALEPVTRCLGYTQLLTTPATADVPRPEPGCRTLTARVWGGAGGDDCESTTGDAGAFASGAFVLAHTDVVTVIVGEGGKPGAAGAHLRGEHAGASTLLVNGAPVLVAEGGAGAQHSNRHSGLSIHACAKGGDGMVMLSWEP